LNERDFTSCHDTTTYLHKRSVAPTPHTHYLHHVALYAYFLLYITFIHSIQNPRDQE
jgi:hypothetical protein